MNHYILYDLRDKWRKVTLRVQFCTDDEYEIIRVANLEQFYRQLWENYREDVHDSMRLDSSLVLVEMLEDKRLILREQNNTGSFNYDFLSGYFLSGMGADKITLVRLKAGKCIDIRKDFPFGHFVKLIDWLWLELDYYPYSVGDVTPFISVSTFINDQWVVIDSKELFRNIIA